jgi:DNA polymerase V
MVEMIRLYYTVCMNSILAGVSNIAYLPVPIDSLPTWVTQFHEKVHAGFASPAEDLGEKRIDLTAELVTHPDATYLTKACGHSMVDFGIFNGDLLVVNRALDAKHGSIVLAVLDGECTVKMLYKRQGIIKLQAGNANFPDIVLKDEQQLIIWGVIAHTIKSFTSKRRTEKHGNYVCIG